MGALPPALRIRLNRRKPRQKGGSKMMRILKPLAIAAAILALTVPLAMAQTGPASPSTPGAPGAPGPSDLPAPRTPSPPQEKLIDGPVKNVDPVAKTVQVGWFLGLLSTTLEVTGDTQIAVAGMKTSLLDIREGDKVKASYEARDGKNIAKSIEVAPRGSTAPPSGSPRTP
jgi:Cu/Ag efflux protein CusF